MQNAKTGSFCLQIINWVKNCFGLANGRCCRTFNHQPHNKHLGTYFPTKNWWWSNKVVILWTGLVGAKLWEGWWSVRRDGKWGIINSSAEEVLPTRHDDIDDFSDDELKNLDQILFIEDEILYRWYFDNKDSDVIPNNKVSKMLKGFRLHQNN